MNVMRKGGFLIKWLIFLLLLTGAVFAAACVTKRKESDRKYADLKAAAPKADVLFLGSSHVINGINPVQLYEEYGIASVNLGGHGSILPASYYELLLALKYASPRLVVVDGYMMEKDYHYLDLMTEDVSEEVREASIGQLHLNLDVFPFSRTKLFAVRDLISDRKTQAEFLFPFILYHNRWSALEEDDYALPGRSGEANRLFGAEIRTGVAYRIAPHETGDEEISSDEIHLGEQYLQMILQTCRERGIEVALTFLPCNATSADRQTAARLSALSAAEGLPYLDLLAEPVTDPDTDFSDEGHLNLLGMTKVSRRVGAFLREQTQIPDRQGDPDYSLWEKRAAACDELLDNLASEAVSLPEALLTVAADPDSHHALLYLSGTGAAIGDPAVRHLLDVMIPGNGLREAAAAGEPALFVLPAGGEGFDIAGYQVTDWLTTDMGSLEVIQVDRFTGLYLDGDEEDNLLDMEDGRLADAQLILLSPEDPSIRKHSLFYYNTESSVIK